MITMDLLDAQRTLPDLAEKALSGEAVLIAVGARTLRLVPVAPEPAAAAGRRLGRGSWKGIVTALPEFYQPWPDEDMGEPGS